MFNKYKPAFKDTLEFRKAMRDTGILVDKIKEGQMFIYIRIIEVKNGLLFEDGKIIPAIYADIIAQANFWPNSIVPMVYAEHITKNFNNRIIILDSSNKIVASSKMSLK